MTTPPRKPVTLRTDPPRNPRRARTYPCRRCLTVVLHGLDDDTAATSVTVDLPPLTNHLEALALIAGRHTYEVTWNGARGYTIDKRAHWRISHIPAGEKGYADGRRTIHAEHQCYNPTPTTNETPLIAHYNPHAYIIPDEPPF